MMAFGEERENFFDFSFPRVFFLSPFSFPPPRKIQGTKKNERRRSKKKGWEKRKKKKRNSLLSSEREFCVVTCVCVCVRFPPLARFASIVSLRLDCLSTRKGNRRRKRRRRGRDARSQS